MGTATGFSYRLFFSLFSIVFLYIPFTLHGKTLESIFKKGEYNKVLLDAVSALLVEAEEEGIPQEMLIPKLEEGAQKKVSSERLLVALRDDIGRLKVARDILRGVEGGSALLNDPASWARTANLIAGGVKEGEIMQIARSSRNRLKDYREATYLFISLVRWGLPRERSLLLTSAVLGSSLESESFAGILDILSKGRRLRILPESLADCMIKALPRVKTLQELEEMCLYK